MAAKSRLRVGEILLKEGLITEFQLQEAVLLHKKSGKRLGEALVSLHHVSEVQLAEILGKQLGLPYLSLTQGGLTPASDPRLKKLISDEIARKYTVLPLKLAPNGLTVALSDPSDLIVLDNLKKITGYPIQPMIATKSDLLQAIEFTYGKQDLLRKVVAETYTEEKNGSQTEKEAIEILAPEETLEAGEDLEKLAGEAQVVRLVDLFLVEAIDSRASDIHIEPYLNRISIRLRVDGVLHPMDPPAPHLMLAIISRIKVLSKMDIAEKRLPQDGGFTVRLGERTVDLRVSTIPVVYGEKVVIRLLDKGSLIFNFKEMGVEGQALEDLERSITAPYGLVFITGPTGSGKSTTLYAAMNRIKSPTKNLLSIEDPVEYKMDGINQVQAKPHIGLTFAAGLRAFLRQDPDIIMVGEVRDAETAEICLRAALTGHLVLSTLHTNDAASAVTRLMDLGIEPFLLSPSLILVVAQRLVRRLCPQCKEPFEPNPAMRERAKLPSGQYFQAKGCAACRKTGYRGRVGIFEVLRATDKIRELIDRSGTTQEIKQAATAQGMKTLLESGLVKAAAGITTLEEVFGVTIGEM